MTKTRPLPATDLAEQCLRSEEEQWVYLRRLARAGRRGGQGSYQPTRRTSPDIWNVQPPMIGSLPATPWEEVEKLIKQRSWNKAVEEKNLPVAKSLHDFVKEHRITGRHLEGPPLAVPIGLMGVQTRFWEPNAIVVDARISFTFLDLRRKFGLTGLGERVVFSFMDVIGRSGYAEYGSAGMLIYQFADDDDRTIVVRDALKEKVDLLTFDELETRTARTYEIWLRVQSEDDKRESDPGPLFGGKKG
jgi:hypothetical protein